MQPFPEGSSFLKGGGVKASAAVAQRMLERYKRIIDANLEYIRGKTILDLASHNGRWTYAAIMAGANFVLGIEGRQYLIDRGLTDFANIDSAKYSFACGDIFDMHNIVRETCGLERFDTILCLGIFYHITDHYRLFRLMRSYQPKAIIIDGGFLKTTDPIIKFRTENTEDHSMAIREPDGEKTALSGSPSVGFLHLAAKISGYKASMIQWKAEETEFNDSVADYLDDSKNSMRMTFRLTRQ